MAKEYTDILTPVGRMVYSNLYTAQVNKSDDPSKPDRESWGCGIAIPKGTEQHWSQTEWGAKIWNAGHAGYAAQADAPTFSWKVIDGDSQIPNKAGNVPREQEGYAGHWIVNFSQGNPPRIVNKDGSQLISERDAVKPGYFIQVFGSVSDNKSASGQPAKSPGVYLNLSIVSMQAYGPEIQGRASVDAKTVGFGAAPLPAGALAAPVAAMSPVAAPMAPPPAAAPAPIAVTPNVGFANPGMTPPPPAAPAAPAHQMTATATATYEAYIAAGWNDAQLRANGFIL